MPNGEVEAIAVARDAAPAGDTRGVQRARADRIYFGAMALICGVTILGGFTPTYFLRTMLSAGAPPLHPIVLIHGALFTAWVLLFLTQNALISAQRRELHMRLGLAGAVVVAAMVAISLPLIIGFEQGHGAEPPITRAIHLSGNVAPLALFAGFALAGIAWRRRSDVHKRLMLFATLALQPAGFARLIGYFGINQSVNIPVFAVLCASVVIYDLCIDKRVRPVSLLGALMLFGSVYVIDLLFVYLEVAPA